MGTVKILQATDFHFKNDEDLETRMRELKKTAHESDVDIAYFGGDFFDEQDPRLYQELMQTAQQELYQTLETELGEDVAQAFGIAQTINQLGGLERISALLQSGKLNEEQTQQLTQLTKVYQENEEAIHQSLELVKPYMEEFERKHAYVTGQVKEAAKRNYERMDELLADFSCETWGVRGNHDIDPIYDVMKNLKFVEKEGSLVLKGIKFAGAGNWYEMVLPEQFYKDATIDPVSPQQIAEIIQEHGSKEDLEAYVKSVQEDKNPFKFPEYVLDHLEEYQRLNDVEADVLLTHKGHGKMAGQGDRYFGSGMGLELAMQKMQPKVVLGGHVHGPLYTEDHGYQGFRTGDKHVYILNMDTDTKQVVSYDVFEWEKQKLVYRETIDLQKEGNVVSMDDYRQAQNHAA